MRARSSLFARRRHRGRVALARLLVATAQEAGRPDTPAAGMTRAQLEQRARRFGPSTSSSTTSSTRAIPTRTRRSIAGRTASTCSRATSVIEDILLFAPGDPFISAAARRVGACAARARLHRRGVRSSPARYDAATNSVDVDVHVRDSWSLALELEAQPHAAAKPNGASGSPTTTSSAPARRSRSPTRATIDRDQATLGYARRQRVRQPRAAMRAVLANASDGHRRELCRRAAVLLARHALVARRLDSRRAARRHDVRLGRGDRRVRPRHRRGDSARRLVARRRRARTRSAGCSASRSEEHTFAPTPDVPQPLLLPPDRKLVYPWIGWQLIEDDYREMTELNDMGRTEDIALGFNLFAQHRLRGGALRLGPRRDAVVASTAEKGWEPGGPGRLLLLEPGASTRARTWAIATRRSTLRRTTIGAISRSTCCPSA